MIVLGSTGSIGVNTLLVAKRFNLDIEVLVAGNNIELLNYQLQSFSPKLVIVANEQDIIKVNENVKVNIVFNKMRKKYTHMALVIRKDTLLGLVTMEDLLEELVGEIEDEKDSKDIF